MSHSERDIRDQLANKIRKQLKLDTNNQLADLVNCPMDGAAYIAVLRAKNVKI
jgi:hypothetical protein